MRHNKFEIHIQGKFHPMKTAVPNSKPVSFERLKPLLAVVFFALLFFLCSADLTFAVRLGGYNFRWGQLLLFIAAILTLIDLARNNFPSSSTRSVFLKLTFYWIPFLLVYALA